MINYLSIKSFRNRKFTSFLCILSVSLSLSLFLVVEKVRIGIEEGFTNSISNADLIVGSRSGPLQLLLYTVFHIGQPTNNITMDSYNLVKNNPMVDWTIPISLGDSYKGYRVVGTDQNFYKHYQFHGEKKLELNVGKWEDNVFDVVLGSTVASELSHKLDDSVVVSHGISKGAIFKHDNTPFKVTGILKPTGTPVDKSVFISLYGMEAIHVGWNNGAPGYGEVGAEAYKKENLKTEQIPSFVLRTKNRIALLGLQRFIATYEKEALTAIIPAATLTDLWGMLDQLEKAFLAISSFVVVIGFLTILISLYMSLDQRRREMAILRSLGVSVKEITTLLIFDAFILSLMGVVLGFVFQYSLLYFIGPILESQYSVLIPISLPTSKELMTVLVFIGLGTISGIIPAIKAYKTTLSTGLSVR